MSPAPRPAWAIAAFAAAAAMALAACTPEPQAAVAPKPPPAVVAAVTADINARLIERGAHEAGDSTTPPAAGGRVDSAPLAMFSPVDVNNDGVMDWRINWEKAPNPSFFCGSGGCLNQLYVSRPGGAFDMTLELVVGESMALSTVNNERVVDVNFHGSVCGLAGAEACPRRFAWDEGARRWQERPNARGQTVLRGPLVQTVPVVFAQLPFMVQSDARTLATACMDAGGRLESGPEHLVESIPDVSGDGKRDWAVGALARCEGLPDGAAQPPLKVGVWAASAEGARPLYATLGASYAIDIAGKPATFVVARTGEECGESGVCADVRLHYDPGTGSLLEPGAVIAP